MKEYITNKTSMKYNKVSRHKISQPRLKEDLITYEVGVEKDCNEEEKLVFRAEFEDTEFEIYAEQIEIKEKMINK